MEGAGFVQPRPSCPRARGDPDPGIMPGVSQVREVDVLILRLRSRVKIRSRAWPVGGIEREYAGTIFRRTASGRVAERQVDGAIFDSFILGYGRLREAAPLGRCVVEAAT